MQCNTKFLFSKIVCEIKDKSSHSKSLLTKAGSIYYSCIVVIRLEYNLWFIYSSVRKCSCYKYDKCAQQRANTKEKRRKYDNFSYRDYFGGDSEKCFIILFLHRYKQGCKIPLFFVLSIFSVHVKQTNICNPLQWLLISTFTTFSPHGGKTPELLVHGCDRDPQPRYEISPKVYKVRQHETMRFNLCRCLSTFNDALRSSLGRKTHISMQMGRTNTNKYACLADQIKRSRSHSLLQCLNKYALLIFVQCLFCLVCPPVCLGKQYYPVPVIILHTLWDGGRFNSQTKLSWGDLKGIFWNQIKWD